MLDRRTVLRAAVMCLTAGVLLAADAALSAKPPKNNRRKRAQQARQQRIRENQRRLAALKQQEGALKRQVAYLETQLPLVRSSLQQAEQRLAQEQQHVAEVRSQFDQTAASMRSLSAGMREISQRVESRQPPDSPLAAAAAAYSAARLAYNQTIARIASSPGYQAAYARASEGSEPGSARAVLRKRWIDENPQVVAARQEMLSRQKLYEQALQDALREDSEWLSTAENLQAASKRHAELNAELEKLSRSYRELARAVAQFRAQVQTMEAALPQSKAALNRIPAMRQSLERQIARDRH